jgi:hypothetical protein
LTPRSKEKIEVDDIIIVWVAQCLICAIFSAIIGAEKGRSGGGYFFCGLLFGVLGLIFAAGMPATKAIGVIAEQPTSLQPELSEAEKEQVELEKAAVEKRGTFIAMVLGVVILLTLGALMMIQKLA